MTNDESIFRNQAEILTKALKDREDELVRCGEAIFELRRLSESRLAIIDELQDVCGDSADRMVELRKERDDARIRYCRQQAAIAKGMATPEQVANNLNWDCFKEDGK